MRFVFLWSLLFCLCALSAFGWAGQGAAQATTDNSTSCGYLGVAVVPVNERLAAALGMTEARGAFVRDVQEGSPAAKSGLKPEDVVLQFDGTDIDGSTDLGTLVSQTRPNHKASLTVLRHGSVIRITTRLAARPSLTGIESMTHLPVPPAGFLIPEMPGPALRWQSRRAGIEYESVDSQLAEFFGVKHGVLVRFVLPHSVADRAGLKAGDVLTRFNGKDVEDARDLATFLQYSPLPKTVPIDVVRDHKRRSLTLPIASTDGFLP